MEKGFLLIDGAKNTLLIPIKSDEMDDLTKHYIRGNLSCVHTHANMAELNKDIKAYLKGEYTNYELQDN